MGLVALFLNSEAISVIQESVPILGCEQPERGAEWRDRDSGIGTAARQDDEYVF
jgi:hypothetical protein